MGSDNTGMERTLGQEECWIADGLLAGGPHMGYFDIILADGVKLC